MIVAGILLAGSTPITGFLSYAIVSTLFGESRFEGADGLTTAGFVALGLPFVLGAFLVCLGFATQKLPSRSVVAALAVICSLALLSIGLRSTQTANDASIGGGLLVLASLPMGAVAVALLMSRRNRK